MKRRCGALGVVVLISGVATGQTGENAPAFQVADVHESAKATNPYMRGGFIVGGRFEVRSATMLELIATAYDFEAEKIAGGPAWLNTDRFDILAGAPATTSQETAKLMLQSLLAERFKLAVHKDTRPLPVFLLSSGKSKPRAKESDGKTPSGCQVQPQPNSQPLSGAFTVVACRNVTMAVFAEALRGMANAYLGNTVIDSTGLIGAWDFDIKWHQRNQIPAAGSEATTIFDAVDKQLGLKLERQTRPLPVLVVDGVNRNPTENAPDVTKKLPPPPPAEFEVATIKPSAPDSPPMGRVQNGRVDLQGLTLKNVIQLAWDIDNDQMMAGLPKFAESVRYNIAAKAPSGVAATNEDEADIDTLRLMLRSLLIERFKLAAHTEDRPVEGYTLTATKPKLEKADPSGRTECKDGPGKDGKDPRIANPVLNRLVTCTNVTMAQFAERLPQFANGYVRTAVLDSTGIEGAWDVTVSFSGVNLIRNNGAPGQPGTPADPNGALSLPDAVAKQLGLKLQLQKRMMPVLVIEHLEEKPSEN